MIFSKSQGFIGVSMISGSKSGVTATMVMEKEKVAVLSPRILELRKKIHSQEYIDNAIQRIAQVISNHLVEDPEELKFSD